MKAEQELIKKVEDILNGKTDWRLKDTDINVYNVLGKEEFDSDFISFFSDQCCFVYEKGEGVTAKILRIYYRPHTILGNKVHISYGTNSYTLSSLRLHKLCVEKFISPSRLHEMQRVAKITKFLEIKNIEEIFNKDSGWNVVFTCSLDGRSCHAACIEEDFGNDDKVQRKINLEKDSMKIEIYFRPFSLYGKYIELRFSDQDFNTTITSIKSRKLYLLCNKVFNEKQKEYDSLTVKKVSDYL